MEENSVNDNIIDLNELRDALSDTAFELSGFKFALDEAAIVAVTDIKGTITYVNRKFCEISRYSVEELIGNNHRIINSGYHPKSFFREMYRTITRGRTWRGQIRNKAKDGTLYWVDTTIVPLKNRNGQLTKYVSIRFDITEQKKTEERLRNTLLELERSNKELEQFAYIASHDLREPLRVISSYVQLLERRYKDRLDETAGEFIQFIVDGTSRMRKLIEGLLSYSRVTTQAKNFEVVDCNIIINEILSDLKIVIEENKARIVADQLPAIFANRIQIRQLLQNLINNAIKYHGDEAPVVHISASEMNNIWEFSVKDNGIGIEPEYYDRIFMLFQRLHEREKYPGTGIGLAVCKRIVENHGGTMRVESEPGKGSVFYFTIPAQ